MKLIVGLGNPETRYARSRHNAGWIYLDFLARQGPFASWQDSNKFHANIARGHLAGTDILLAQPTTHMNDSGSAVEALMNFYQFELTDFLLVYDDLDLTFGTYKLTDHSPHTHNGVASVKSHLPTSAEFLQLRLGVDDRAGERQIPPMDYVLMPLSPDQLNTWEKETFPTATREVESWL
ncbi:aminoacyl-tRNA hydrolase [bacterium]|nr:aminoacyl-tRNA hydrolase [bacterium]